MKVISGPLPETWGLLLYEEFFIHYTKLSFTYSRKHTFYFVCIAQVTNVKHNTSIINQYECHFSSKLHIYVYKVQSSCPQSLIPSTFLHSYIVLLVLVLSISINISINITINQSGGVKLVLCAQASPLRKMMQVFSICKYNADLGA